MFNISWPTLLYELFILGFTYSWATVGFILPVCVLGYCNISLIKSLNVSIDRAMGKETESGLSK